MFFNIHSSSKCLQIHAVTLEGWSGSTGSKTQIWVRDSNLCPGPKFGPGTQIWLLDPHLGPGPKFGSGTQIWVWDPNFAPGP